MKSFRQNYDCSITATVFVVLCHPSMSATLLSLSVVSCNCHCLASILNYTSRPIYTSLMYSPFNIRSCRFSQALCHFTSSWFILRIYMIPSIEQLVCFNACYCCFWVLQQSCAWSGSLQFRPHLKPQSVDSIR